MGFPDFLIFASVFGSQQGDGTYDARIDLNSDGSIGFTDFLIFAQNFGSAPPSTSGGSPDLVVQSPSASSNNVASGATITLGATVRNQGNGSSAVTTLHYYRSDDATVSTSDTQVGTDAVRGLAAGRASAESIDLAAPSDAGTYYYGACVDAVTGESDTGNNCSAAVSITVAAVIPSGDRAALVALYEATDGPNWTDKGNWLSAASLGDWYGVTTDDNGRVTHLHLDSNTLTGAIPPELGQLTNLTSLSLQNTQLTGAIPPELGQLIKLTSLRLGGNQLTGAIPVELARLTKLTELWLSENQLTGAIPPELGQLTHLEWLLLYNNQLTGTLPQSLTGLTKLEKFDFALTGLCAPLNAAFQTWLQGIDSTFGCRGDPARRWGCEQDVLDGFDHGKDPAVQPGRQRCRRPRHRIGGARGHRAGCVRRQDVLEGWDFPTAKIQRSNLDGSGVEDLVTGLEGSGGIALDVSGGKMYWTDLITEKIQRSNLDGSGVEDLVTTGLERPFGIALSFGLPVEAGTDLGVRASVSDNRLTQAQY